MQNKLMLKHCISTRDLEIQTRPVLSKLFPESKAQPMAMHAENANPTWARSPGLIDFTRKACMDIEEEEFLMLPTALQL